MSKCDQCIVKELSALKALTKSQLLTLSDCKTSKEIKKGDSLFGEDENLKGIYCINKGVCKLTKKSTNGYEQTVRLVSKGDLLGQRSLISNEVTTLNAIAINDMSVCFIPKNAILDFLIENNNFSVTLLKAAFDDLKETRNKLVDMAQKVSKSRLGLTLLYLEETFGTQKDGTLALALSRDDLARIIGTTTESCIRLLSEFNKNKLIELDRKKIKIINKEELIKISN